MLSILDLYSEQKPVWTADELIEQLGFSRPTGYRYVRELCAAGLLMRIPGGVYVLGPRVLELDFVIRQSDPVLQVGRPIMKELLERTGCDVTLANIYGDQIQNVHHEPGPQPLRLSYDRGRPHPLFRGATSRAILAFLPRARLKRLYEKHAREVAAARLGRSWDEFREALQPVRKQGYSISHGQLDAHLTGIAAPLLGGLRDVLGSLTLVTATRRFAVLDQAAVVDMLLDAARRMSEAIAHISHPKAAVRMPMPARAGLRRVK
jgi:DNA-binding IclR family transcriptional regulator